MQAREAGRSECHPVMGCDRDSNFVPSERRADFLGGCNAPPVLLGKDDLANL